MTIITINRMPGDPEFNSEEYQFAQTIHHWHRATTVRGILGKAINSNVLCEHIIAARQTLDRGTDEAVLNLIRFIQQKTRVGTFPRLIEYVNASSGGRPLFDSVCNCDLYRTLIHRCTLLGHLTLAGFVQHLNDDGGVQQGSVHDTFFGVIPSPRRRTRTSDDDGDSGDDSDEVDRKQHKPET